MIHSVDPRQNRLFDPFEGVIPPAGRKIIENGWQGIFRHAILEVMPVGELAKHFSDSLGAPTKELWAIPGKYSRGNSCFLFLSLPCDLGSESHFPGDDDGSSHEGS